MHRRSCPRLFRWHGRRPSARRTAIYRSFSTLFCLMAYADAEGQYADALFSVLQMLLDGALDAQSMVFLQCVEVMAEAGRSLEMVPLARADVRTGARGATLTAALGEALY